MTADEVRAFVLSLPEVEERETWGEPTFRVREKIFAVLSPDGREAGVKAAPEDQDLLVRGQPEVFAVAHYTGRFGWVTVRLAEAEPGQVEKLLKQAWRRTAPKRLVAAYGRRSQPLMWIVHGS